MRASRLFVLAAGLAAALVAAPAALPKEGVRATLTTPIPLDAAPGTKLHVGWTLANRDGTPFGAGDVFVRLRSASGDGAETTYVNGPGTFEADVVVPKDGIGDVQIGLRGFSSGPDGTREAPMFFPITNDPLPGEFVPPPSDGGGDGSTPWTTLVVATALLAAAAVALFLMRRNRGRFALSADRGQPGPSRTPTGT